MSEFQGYAFQAVDRPLTPEQMAELRAISTRAEITPTHFSNFYTYGDFKGDVRDMMTRYFDAFVYVANWGSRQLMFRLPAKAFDLDAAKAYETETTVGVSRAGKGAVLIDFGADEEEGSEWLEEDDADRWLAVLLPLREELLAGDLRALYLGWLAGVEQDEVEDDEEEPPVTPGLGNLSGPLRELAGFLYIGDDLLSVAAEASRPAAPVRAGEMAAWLRGLAAPEKDDLLLAAMRGEAAQVGRALLRRFHQERPRGAEEAEAAQRTAGQLREACDERAERERQRQEEEAARQRARRERQAAERQARRLDALAGQEDRLWREVEQAVASRLPKQYDAAVSTLKDLRELAGRAKAEAAFRTRLRALREAHAAKRTFIERLDKAGLSG